MNRDINSYYRSQSRRPQIPHFQPPTRLRRMEPHYSGAPPIEMNVLNRRPSFDEQISTISGDNTRPNRVISGHRNFNTLYIGPRSNFDKHANKIVEKMEENQTLMEDTPLSEQLRKEALRELPQCLTMKRCVKNKLSKSVSQKSKRKPISWWKSLKYRININFAKFKYKVKNFNYFELWHGTLKNIESRFGSGYASYFKFLRWLFVMNFFISVVSFAMLAVPQIIYDSSGVNGTVKNTREFQFEDIFTGEGFFTETVLYYGHYTSNYINLLPHLYYDMPAAYFSVTVILYLISFFVLAISVAQSYRRTFIETEGGLQNIYANKVFCGWDYGIATREAAELQSSAIYHELKELLSEDREEHRETSCLNKFYTVTIQIVVNILILIVVSAVGWVCWVLLDEFSAKNDLSVIVTTVVVNIIMMIFPLIFSYVSKYEDYKNPRITLYINLARTYLLGSVFIGVILTFWLLKATSSDPSECWENRLVAEVYRLIVFDFFFSIVLTAILDFLYTMIRKMRGKNPKSEFNISRHILQIIYNQGLFWVAFLYSPILPLLVTFKMLLIWYIREVGVRKFCRPPKRIWKAAQSQTWFMVLIFVSNLLIIAVHGYTMKTIASSQCGPFKDYEYMYQIVTKNMSDLEENSTFWSWVILLTKPGAVALMMIALAILVYYVQEQAYVEKGKVNLLREMLVLMGKDKKFLVNWYNEVTKGHFELHMRDNNYIDPSKLLPHESFHEFGDKYGAIRSPVATGVPISKPLNSQENDEFTTRFRAYT